jgi:DNA-binding NtrC family response regulator
MTKHRILIVDDEDEIRSSLKRRYMLRGYRVDVAENGEAALGLMAESSFHVVVSDIRMPVMDGIDLLRRIRSEYPMTRTIMITGYVTMENALACLRYGADTVVFKPFADLTELDGAVERALAHLEHWNKKLLALSEMKGSETPPLNK